MNCPNCKSAMSEDKYEGVVLDFCPGCRGVWASNEEMAHVVMTSEKAFKPDQVIDTLKTQWQNTKRGQSRACPSCGDALKEFNYAGLGVYLDRCAKDHGIFFDASELEKVQILVERQTMAAAPKAAAAQKSPRKCPHCAVDLAHANYEGVTIDECGACGGAWLDSGELEEVIRQRVKQFSASDKAAAKTPKAAAQRQQLRPAVLCPVCRDVMKRLSFAYDAGIVIDKCVHGHGIWLDQGEIELVQAFIEGAEGLADADRAKWGGSLKKAAANMKKRREEFIKNMKFSRYGIVNRFARLVAKGVV